MVAGGWRGALLLLALASPATADEPLLHAMFRDHAVLQRDRPLPVYGRAAPGEDVTVTLGVATAHASADASGRWTVLLPAQPAGGPFTLTARAASGRTQSAADVMVGDVFLCSGQSNMVLEVKYTLNAAAEIRNGANSTIRALTVANAISPAPQDTFASPVEWQVASRATVADWSATCFYMARELQKTVRVPIGLVVSAWNGSNIRPWMSEAALRAVGGYETGLDVLGMYARDQVIAAVRWGQMWQDWWRSRAANGAAGEPWSIEAAGDAAWRAAPDGLGFWESWGVSELSDFNGMVWYRTSVRLTAAQAAQSATLSLGMVDEIDESWLNGRAVGSTSGAGLAREYPVAAGSLRAGDNHIVVNALDTYGTGGMYGPPERRALRLANGETIPLTAWRYQVVPTRVGSPPRAPWESTGGLTTIRNAMIAPMGPFAFRGAVWYQGESNTGQPEQYERLLAGLMADWRGTFGADLPFLIVQLAGYGAANSRPVESGWAGLREAERMAVLHDGHAGLAVAVDIGDRYDIHPPNKQELGRRLSRAARRVIYGEAITPSGPVPVSARRAGQEVIVTFTDIERELVAYGADGPIGFELCGSGLGTCRFVPARLDGATVRLALGAEPATRVRFCWGDSPVCTLYDRAGLPAGPFELAIE